ncbi:uncharacterized protein LOC134246140, partial [Saccostrea cucullata]|uniref:uncharacterized protein LOC134246140 n=1 Tax=Saccostrea cuccullata TaxID=36930 RepID=UPI002ED1AE8E
MNIFFIIIHFLSINEVSSKKKISDQKMNWLDAQNFCQKQGMVSKAGKLSFDEQDSGKYWTCHYTKRSDWIHFLGCFDQDTVLHYATSNLTILDKTYVKCQLFCLPDSEIFGIQGNSCFCLSTLDPHAHPLHINWCNLFNEKFPVGNEMNNSIFIYRNIKFNAIRSDKTDATNHQKDLCVQIFCVKFNEVKFTMADCESIGNALCTNKVLLGSYTWLKAMQKCDEQSTAADYLEADIDLYVHSAFSNLCTNYNISLSGPLWLGIQSSTLELEYKDDLTKVTKDMKCQSCRKVCKFEDCSKSRQAFCEA